MPICIPPRTPSPPYLLGEDKWLPWNCLWPAEIDRIAFFPFSLAHAWHEMCEPSSISERTVGLAWLCGCAASARPNGEAKYCCLNLALSPKICGISNLIALWMTPREVAFWQFRTAFDHELFVTERCGLHAFSSFVFLRKLPEVDSELGRFIIHHSWGSAQQTNPNFLWNFLLILETGGCLER